MKLKLTLQRPSGPEADIVVTADAGATVGDIAMVIDAVDPYRAKTGATGGPATLRSVGGSGFPHTVLEPSTAIADAPWAPGRRWRS